MKYATAREILRSTAIPTMTLRTNSNFVIDVFTDLNLKKIKVETPMMHKGQVTYRVQMKKAVGANAMRNKSSSDIMCGTD